MDSNFADLQASNPFAMLLDLDSVVRDMEHSERLQRLQRRVCHPLDTPLRVRSAAPAADDYDRMIDAMPDEPAEVEVALTAEH